MTTTRAAHPPRRASGVLTGPTGLMGLVVLVAHVGLVVLVLAGCAATGPSGGASSPPAPSTPGTPTASGSPSAWSSTPTASSPSTPTTSPTRTPASAAPTPRRTRAASSPAAAPYALPPTRGVFDYQLGGAYDLPGLTVVGRDSTARPAPGAYSICYVNGFQTQPGDEDTWLGERKHLLLHDKAGRLVVDPDWPDEYVLDPSTAAQRRGILEVIGPVIDGCAARGFDAVEIDNLDTWTRFEQIPAQGSRALAAAYIARAHAAGLAIAQKNAAEHTAAFHRLGFDFAVTEECAVWDECAAYTDVYGAHVLQIEYTDELPRPFAEVCARRDRAPLTILRDRDLVPKGDAGYAYDRC